MDNKLVLIDGHSILNRAFYGVPDLTNAEGLHTNAVYGFLNIMFKILEEENADHLAVAFDLSAPTFRHKMYDAYKGTRKPMPEELREQVPLMKEALQTMNIPILTMEGYEADDILGTVAKRCQAEGIEVSVVSGDRDLLQLADTHIKIRIPKTSKGSTQIYDYYPEDVKEQYQVTPTEFIDVKALMGDTSDNIPGVPGIGEKTAAKIIKEYHSIENAHDHIEEIKPARAKNNLQEYYEQAIMSKDLATIKKDCDISYDFKDAKIGTLFTKEAYQLFKELELKSLFKYFDEEEKEEETLEVVTTSDLGEVENIFSSIKKSGQAGLGVIGVSGNCKGISLTWKEGSVLALIGGFVTEDYLKEKIVELLKEGTELIVLDYKALLHFVEEVREYESQIQDVGIQAYLLNPLQSAYDYEDIARDYLRQMLPSRKEICGKKAIEEVFEAEEEKTVQMAAYLSYVPFHAYPLVLEKLKEQEMEELYLTIERPTVATLYDMEKYGITVEKDALKEYGDQLIGRIEELEQNIYEKAGKTFNINSPKQLGVILFEDLKMPFAKKTKTGYSTNADILEKLAPDYPIVSEILEYRQLTKLKSTYADGLAAFIQDDGKIHSIFHQKVTATGRLSSSDPNLQNIPIRMPLGRAIRKVFVPDPGYVFVSADYSQIELRVLAHMAGDEHLIDAYRHGEDIHRMTASQVFGVPFEEVTPLLRRSAKAVNFGIVYGISAFGLSQDLKISRKEASDYINKYFATYPGIKTYLDGNVAFAKKEGYVKTLYGRIRPIPELSSSNFMQRSFGERVAMNSSIQGTAADIIKIAMVRVSKRLQEENLESRLILQIHDELLIETKENERKEVRKILEEEMMGAAQLKVPLSIDIEEGKTWYEAK